MPLAIWSLIVVLFVFWLLGYGLRLGGDLIHLLLVVILAVVAYRLVAGRRT